LSHSRARPNPWSTEHVEVVSLKADEGEPALTFVLNHGHEAVDLALPGGNDSLEVLSGRRLSGKLELEPYGVALVQG
jgi:hypothetical protein